MIGMVLVMMVVLLLVVVVVVVMTTVIMMSYQQDLPVDGRQGHEGEERVLGHHPKNSDPNIRFSRFCSCVR